MRIRAGAALAASAGALAAVVVVGTLTAGPVAAQTPGPAAAGAAAATATTTYPVPPTASMSPSTATPTSTSCYQYTPPTLGPGGVAQSWDFEDGTTGGWTASGNGSSTTSGPGVTVQNVTDVAFGGTHSLRLTGLTASNAVGVTVNRMADLSWYTVTAHVRLPAGAASTYLVLTPSSSETAASQAGTVRVTGDGWAVVTASFRPMTMYADWYCNGQMTGTQMPASARVQLSVALVPCGSTDTATSVYVDDVAVTRSPGSSTSAPPPVTTAPGAGCTPPPTTSAMQCTATYHVQSQWPGGYLATVAVRNATATALPTWTLRWTFPGGQQVSSLWGAGAWTQAGTAVTVGSAAWTPLAAGGTASLGFVASGSPGTPTAATLSGMDCVVSTT